MGAIFQKHHITHASTLLHKIELLQEKKIDEIEDKGNTSTWNKAYSNTIQVSTKPFRRAHAKKFKEALNRLIQAT